MKHNANTVKTELKNIKLGSLVIQARNQDFMWGGANETKVDQTTEMYFLSNSF